MIWNWGSFSKRSKETERRESHEISDPRLHRLLSYQDFQGRFLGGHRIVLNFLEAVSGLWPPGLPLTILDVRAGLGGLSRSVVQWARKRNVEIHITAIEKYARIVHMAREKNRSTPEIQFEVRGLSDPLFLQAQQFDYVISDGGLHGEIEGEVEAFFITINRLAKRGIAVTDFLRDARAAFWLKNAARMSRSEDAVADAELAVRKGFTLGEVKAASEKAGLKFSSARKHMGYRFSVTGERGLVFSGAVQRVAGLAGT